MKRMLKKTFSLVLAVFLVLGTFAGLKETKAMALANHVVINEIFGGGGNRGAPYQNDFVELYNPTGSDVSLSGWSVQYASKTGTSWQVTALSGTVPSGGYYLIQESGGSAGRPLPVPDVKGSINLSGTAGKVALASRTSAISGKGIPGADGIVDFVGYGSAADTYEGREPTPAPGNTTSVARKTDGADTDENAADFKTQAPGPQNSSASGVKDSDVTFTPSQPPDANGYVPKGTVVALSGAEEGQVICCRKNGGEAQIYQNPIEIDENTTITAWICSNGSRDKADALGEIVTETYQVSTNETGTSSIGQARSAGPGKAATLTGTALSAYNSQAPSLGLYIQDGTGGIMLYGASVLKAAGIRPGDTVEAAGTTSAYPADSPTKFELSVKSVKVVKTPGSVPEPKVTKLSEIGENVGGMLIQIRGAAVSKLAEDKYHGADFTLTQDGSTLSAKLDNRRGSTYSDLAAKVKNGQTADIAGILEGYKGNYTLQLLGADAVTNVQSSSKAASVTAAPGSSAQAKMGDTVALACATPGAVIHYTLDPKAADNQYLIYDASKPVKLMSLPATLMAYATADGMAPSGKSIFNYEAQYNGKYNIYFGQLHSHTTLSDGVGSIDEAYSHASKVKNLDFLAVTDHSNYFETSAQANSTPPANSILDGSNSLNWKTGRAAAKKITDEDIPNSDNIDDPKSDFLGIYGYEMTWSDGSGHVNTYNTPGFEDRQNTYFCNKAQSASNPIGLKRYYDTLTKVPQSISQFNHPGTTFGDFYDFANYSPAYDQLIDLVEVGNGEGPIRGPGYFPSYEYYTRALDKGWHVAPTNNQDNHRGNWGDANTARSVILAPSLTEQNLYDALRNRRVYATEDNDLSIRYTVDGAVMGSEISVPKGRNLSIEAQLSDPTDAKVGKVDVIVNGGRVAATKELDAQKGTVDFTIPNNYSYYYLRVTEPDRDIAVTAPVWTGEVDKAGIASVKADTGLPVKGEACKIITNLYDNEESAMTVKSLEYKVGDTVIQSVDGGKLPGGAEVPSLGTKTCSFSYTPGRAGSVPVSVVMKTMLGGVEHTYTGAVTLQVADPAAVTKILVDGTHFNDYVTGYYSQSMGNVTQIAASDGTQVRVETGKITPDMLKNTQMLVISAPAKYAGTSKAGDSFQPQEFSGDFIKMVRDYVNGGGTAVVCGLSDYSDGKADPYTSSTQVNALLSGIGAKSTISNDEVVDQKQNGGQPYRLYFQKFNMQSPYLKDVDPAQKYSFYSGCSVNPGAGAQWLVRGYDTTYSINSRASNGKYESGVPVSGASDAYDAAKAVKKKGDVCALAEENVGSGHVLIAGTVFLSDFEIKAVKDNNWDLSYANKTIAQNLMNSVKVDIPTTSIANVRKNGQTGDVFEVEGTVTAGSEQPNAFTDTVYLQDASGGINVYPIPNGSGIRVGQKLRVVGHVDAYQGDKELKIGSGVEHYQVIDSSVHPVAPTPLSVEDALQYEKYGGLLVRAEGTVSNLQPQSGAVQSFEISSGGKSIRVLINGYISPNVDLSGIVRNGSQVSVVGLVYTDPLGVCLRVRDRKEIQPAQSQNGNGGGHGGSGESHGHSGGSLSSPPPAPGGDPVITVAKDNGTTRQTIATRTSGAPSVAGGRADLTVKIPDSAASVASGATSQAPAKVEILLPVSDLLAQLGNPAVQVVGLKIQAPSAIVLNANVNAKVTVNLPAAVFTSLFETKKSISVSVADVQNGKVLYSWSFSGKSPGTAAIPAAGVDLALSVKPAGSAAVKGASLEFADNGLLPCAAGVRVYVGDQPGVKPNSILYLYRVNSTAGVLQKTKPGTCTVDADGYATFPVVHCSRYLLLPAPAPDVYPVSSDTTFPVKIGQGGSYTFGITVSGGGKPQFTVGNGKAFRLKTSGLNGRYQVTARAVGKTGLTTALYSTLPGKKPVLLCYLALAR